MSNVNISLMDSLGRAGLSASFLSTLNTTLEGQSQNEGTGLFDNLMTLASNADTAGAEDTTSNANSSLASVNGSSVTSNALSAPTSVTPTPSFADVMSTLQDFIQKWRAYQKNTQDTTNDSGSQPHLETSGAQKSGTQKQGTTQNTPNDTTATSAVSPPTTPPTTTTTKTSLGDKGVTPMADTSASTDTDKTSSSNSLPTITDLLAELQGILHMIGRQLVAVNAGNTDVTSGNTITADKTGATSDTNASTTNTSATPTAGSGSSATTDAADTNLLTAGQLLAELMTIMPFAEKQLAAIQDQGGLATTSATAATETASVPSSLAGVTLGTSSQTALLAELKNDLKSLLDALKTNVAGSNDQTEGTSSLSTPAFSGDRGIRSNTFATAPLSTPSPNALLGTALSAATDYLSQLTSLYGASTPSQAATTVLPPALGADFTSSGGGSDPSFDTGADGGSDWSGSGQTSATSTTDAFSLTAAADGTHTTNPYTFASQLSAIRAENGGTTGLPTAVEQVLLQMSRNVKSGNDQMTLQLQPADLGKINIKLDISSDGKVQGTVVASNPATLDLLLKDVRSLERALQDAGLRADSGSLQFSLGGQPGDTSGQTASDSSSNSSSMGNGSLADTESTTLAVDATDTADSWYLTPGRVNFKV